MQTLQATMLLAVALALAAVPAALADQQCSQVPHVPGIDQSPTNAGQWGLCTGALEGVASGSHWCKAGQMGLWPAPPTAQAQKCLKYGRTTIYRGPIYGSSYGHKAACNLRLKGEDEAAMVAVSTKYLKTYQGGWAGDKGSCGKCMCIRLHGGDDKFNTGLQKEAASKHIGLTFLGKVRGTTGHLAFFWGGGLLPAVPQLSNPTALSLICPSAPHPLPPRSATAAPSARTTTSTCCRTAPSPLRRSTRPTRATTTTRPTSTPRTGCAASPTPATCAGRSSASRTSAPGPRTGSGCPAATRTRSAPTS
jgi:hypothetical protein